MGKLHNFTSHGWPWVSPAGSWNARSKTRKRKVNTEGAGANSVALITLVCACCVQPERVFRRIWVILKLFLFYLYGKKIILENSYSVKFVGRNTISFHIWQKLIQPLRIAGGCFHQLKCNCWSTVFKPFLANQSCVFFSILMDFQVCLWQLFITTSSEDFLRNWGRRKRRKALGMCRLPGCSIVCSIKETTH